MAPPLAGVKVLDLSRMGPGPYCTMLLADLGAEVIKIEQPGFGIIPVDVDEETWAAYYAIDRNKKSITLDFKKAEARRVFHRMAETADVVIEGFRPGVAARLELDYETARAINPRIVYCSITGYGQDGPYRDLPGHDVNYISIAGALSAMAIRDGRPAVPLNMLGDYAGGGLQAAFAIVTALFARDRTGTGQLIDIAMVDGVVSLLSWEASVFFAGGGTPKWGATPLTGGVPCGCVFPTKGGGFVSLGCFEVKFWENLCRELGREDLIPCQFAVGDEKERVVSQLTEVFLTRTKEEWFRLLGPKEIPITPVLELDEVFSDPQVHHRERVVEVDHPRLGKVKHPGIGVKFSETPGEIREFAPLPGQHTGEVLADLGYTSDDITKLREAGAIG
jgi:crotonobetainyl-CoA:carnitine CoA-transferase CaiB-like acyl-CoA transferase